MENQLQQAPYVSKSIFEEMRNLEVSFRAKSVLASLENLMIVTSKPFCKECECETKIIFTGTGKACDICLSIDLLLITPRGQILDMDNLLMLVLSFDCPVEGLKIMMPSKEHEELIQEGAILKFFGMCYWTEALHEWLSGVGDSFNRFAYSLAG